jgi:hypothetical protein
MALMQRCWRDEVATGSTRPSWRLDRPYPRFPDWTDRERRKRFGWALKPAAAAVMTFHGWGPGPPEQAEQRSGPEPMPKGVTLT